MKTGWYDGPSGGTWMGMRLMMLVSVALIALAVWGVARRPGPVAPEGRPTIRHARSWTAGWRPGRSTASSPHRPGT